MELLIWTEFEVTENIVPENKTRKQSLSEVLFKTFNPNKPDNFTLLSPVGPHI